MPRSALFARVRAVLTDASREHPPLPTAALPLGRRRFVEGSIAALATLAAGTAPGCSPRSTVPRGRDPRIAVVGAGMAGLHCAWQLEALGLRPRVFEASRRVGGRMFSLRGHFQDGQVCELGGEFVDTGDAVMHALSAELGLPLDDRTPLNSALREKETWFFEGRHVPSAEVLERFRPIASAMAADMRDVEAEENAERYEALNRMTLAGWLDRHASGDPLVHALLETAYVHEYGLEASEQSALNLLYLIDYDPSHDFHVFGDSDERFHTHAGNDAFAAAIHERLAARVSLGHVLRGVEERADGTLRATFEAGGQRFAMDCDHLVLAIPFTAARDVDFQMDLPEGKLRVLRELGYGTCSKVMLGYASRTWREAGASGSSTSDLGFGQTWETSLGQDGASGILTVYAGGTAGLRAGEGETEARAAELVAAIDRMYPGSSAAYRAGSAVRMAWPTAPYARGAFACYRPGQWEFYGTEGRRVRNLHFAGEHCSTEKQGFMEGAAETGGLVACEIGRDLGLATTPLATRILGERLAMPQSAYYPEAMAGLRKHERRRVVRASRAARAAAG